MKFGEAYILLRIEKFYCKIFNCEGKLIAG